MSNFNNIDYQSFEDENNNNNNNKNNNHIYRKIKIINNSNYEYSNQSKHYTDYNNLNKKDISNNYTEQNNIEDNISDSINDNNYYSTNSMKNIDLDSMKNIDLDSMKNIDLDTMKNIDLDSTMPYGYNKKENRYYDSLTNTSFNDINEFNKLNELNIYKKNQNLKMEIQDTKNIQKEYHKNNLLNNLEDNSEKILDRGDKFKKPSKYLKIKIYLNLICHILALILGVLIIVLFINILIG